jgi:hypothetical protein
VSSQNVKRRDFLKISGLAAGGAFLGPMLNVLRAEAQTMPKNAFIYVTPNGVILNSYRPNATSGATTYAMSPILQPLESYRSDILVLDGLKCNYTFQAPHAAHMSSILTGAAPDPTTDMGQGISIDQYLANKFGVPLYHLGVGYFNAGLHSRVSYKAANTPIAPETNPKTVFDRLVPLGTGTAPAPDQIRALEKSVLDYVIGDLSALKTRLSTSEMSKVDMHLTSIRELELEIGGLNSGTATAACSPYTLPAFTTSQNDYPLLAKIQIDLGVLALACGKTRVVSMLGSLAGSSANYWTWPFLGINRPWHDMTHHGGDAATLAQLVKCQTWFAQNFAYLVGKLKTSGLLANTAAVWTTDLGDAQRHSSENLAFVLAGQCGGHFRTGRYLRMTNGENQTAVWTAIANAMGDPVAKFGSASYAQSALGILR